MSALAMAAAKPSYADPFGLTNSPRLGMDGTASGGLLTPPQSGTSTTTQKNPTQTPVLPLPITAATTPGAAGAPLASVNTTFNLQTDPALQQVNALMGMSDQQAQSAALKQRQNLLLQYGDPNLAAAVLGQTDPTVQAAGQNPESQLAMLARERDQNLRNFETQLDPSLVYSGYRVNQEHQLGQAYQDALAQAAAGVNSGLDQITGNLNAALAADNTNRANALSTAEQNQLQLILSGLAGGAGAGSPITYASIGATPTPIVSGEVAPPVPFGGNITAAQVMPPVFNQGPSLNRRVRTSTTG